MPGGGCDTFECRQFLQLPVVAEAEPGRALPLVLLDRGLGSWLLPLQQLSGGRNTVTALPVGALGKQEGQGETEELRNTMNVKAVA